MRVVAIANTSSFLSGPTREMTRQMVAFFSIFTDATSPLPSSLFVPSFSSLPPPRAPNSGVISDSCSTFPDCFHMTLSSCPVVSSGSFAVIHSFGPASPACNVASCDAGPASLSLRCDGSMGALGFVCSCRTRRGPACHAALGSSTAGGPPGREDALRFDQPLLTTPVRKTPARSVECHTATPARAELPWLITRVRRRMPLSPPPFPISPPPFQICL
mmetsp:Transcript_261/g.760  ORF Transcript_261/g.760 Transcript_261/m.760 type:complete len:217 (+) Transcript_261:1792-2442(+)